MITIPSHCKWLRLLSQRCSCQIAESLLLSASQHYQSSSNQNLNPNQRFHPIIKARVLPVLSVNHAMLDHDFDQMTAIHNLKQLFIDMYFTVQLAGIRFLNRTLPNPFFVIKPFLRLMIRFSDLPEGQEIQQDTSDCFAIDVHQCFIFDTLKAQNTPELTTVFYTSVDHLSAAITKIEWRRTKTLGRDGEICDFCWCRK